MERRRGATVATFFAPERPVPGQTTVLGDDSAHHARVRRLEIGSAARLLDGAGAVATGTFVRIARRSVHIDVVSVEDAEPLPPVHLLLPVADRERMLWLAEKAAELGVASWRPVIFRRSRSVSPRGEGQVFRQKVRARMIAALEQSGGAWLPMMYPEAKLEHAIAATPEREGDRLLLDPAGDPVLTQPARAPISVIVGPEGGVEPDEREMLVAGGFAPVSLAGNVLRFETAAVAGIAIARASLAAANARTEARANG